MATLCLPDCVWLTRFLSLLSTSFRAKFEFGTTLFTLPPGACLSVLELQVILSDLSPKCSKVAQPRLFITLSRPFCWFSSPSASAAPTQPHEPQPGRGPAALGTPSATTHRQMINNGGGKQTLREPESCSTALPNACASAASAWQAGESADAGEAASSLGTQLRTRTRGHHDIHVHRNRRLGGRNAFPRKLTNQGGDGAIPQRPRKAAQMPPRPGTMPRACRKAPAGGCISALTSLLIAASAGALGGQASWRCSARVRRTGVWQAWRREGPERIPPNNRVEAPAQKRTALALVTLPGLGAELLKVRVRGDRRHFRTHEIPFELKDAWWP